MSKMNKNNRLNFKTFSGLLVIFSFSDPKKSYKNEYTQIYKAILGLLFRKSKFLNKIYLQNLLKQKYYFSDKKAIMTNIKNLLKKSLNQEKVYIN